MVEVDGAYFGGYIRPKNRKEDRIDRRKAMYQTGKRSVVVVACERGWRTLSFVFKTEEASVSVIAARIALGSAVYADEAASWDKLHARFLKKRINHSESYNDGDACTNQAKSFFSRLFNVEKGVHQRISDTYLGAYAGEMAKRVVHRHVSNSA